jgi:hypothetical protein
MDCRVIRQRRSRLQAIYLPGPIRTTNGAHSMSKSFSGSAVFKSNWVGADMVIISLISTVSIKLSLRRGNGDVVSGEQAAAGLWEKSHAITGLALVRQTVRGIPTDNLLCR